MNNSNKLDNNNKMANGCPFQPKRGYIDARTDYLYHFHGVDDDDDQGSGSDGSRDKLPTASRVASTNTDDPLYFWQLYSLIGHDLVVEIVSDFYERVFADTENPWFRDVFDRAGPQGHHINTQVAYWVDAFGGGRCYHGGNFRLNFHHTHNAREIMTAKGAHRWMHHMRAALISVKKNRPRFPVEDPRVFPCIVSFLETKMRTYAEEHGWKFDERDFASLKEAMADGVKKNEETVAYDNQEGEHAS